MRIVVFSLTLLVTLSSCNPKFSRKDHSIYWQKNATEYKALCIQAYNSAKLELNRALFLEHEKPIAVVADIDETVLNNLPYNEMLIEKEMSFSQATWSEWVNKEIATAIPGALDFYAYAERMGVEVIYISNRREENYAPTKSNLVALGFPFDEDTIMLLRDETSSKEDRRNQLANFNVVLFLGDNLSDFDVVFDKQTNTERNRALEEKKSDLGQKFILIPNLIYGAWEDGFK
ncbi:MAG: 5'-nucleotidase, lipoprotein e(P4) family [Flavobacteriaceae bacterium]|nr:5'-nucleotidase, lipoprotein e(P4) family [Flavobacteriaceae bacterium]